MTLHVFNGTTRETMNTTFEELISGYESLQAISFVGSFKMINDLILPAFDSVRVILGKEDDETGNRFKWDMERAATIADELESLDQIVRRAPTSIGGEVRAHLPTNLRGQVFV